MTDPTQAECDLAACPFCGSEVTMTCEGTFWTVRCPDEMCPAATTNGAFPRKEAIARWNSRTVSAAYEAMRKALEPFAAIADEYDEREDDEFEVWRDAGPEKSIRASFKLALYRAARAALAGGQS